MTMRLAIMPDNAKFGGPSNARALFRAPILSHSRPAVPSNFIITGPCEIRLRAGDEAAMIDIKPESGADASNSGFIMEITDPPVSFLLDAGTWSVDVKAKA